MSSTSTPTNPWLSQLQTPQRCFHPLLLLNQYLATTAATRTRIHQDDAPRLLNIASSQQQQQQELDELLVVVDVLYGSILEGALMVLDQQPQTFRNKKNGGMNDENDNIDRCCYNITKYTTPQQHGANVGSIMYTVQTQTSSSHHHHHSEINTAITTTVMKQHSYLDVVTAETVKPYNINYYLCILPDNNNETTIQNTDIYYCSCRSFLEKCRHSTATTTTTTTTTSGTTEECCYHHHQQHTTTNLCKHLLAIKLMPVLGRSCIQHETRSNEELAHILSQRIVYT